MKIGIFGASGFVGRNIVEKLSEQNLDFVASDVRNVFDTDVSFQKADLLDYDQVESVVKQTDIVIHLAAHPLPASIENPRLNAKINIEGTLNILDAARKHDVTKIIFSSASSLVGEVRYNPVDEVHPCVPKTPYGVAKYATEHYLRVYRELYGLNYLVFRFFNIYGPWQFPESGALIPMVYNKLSNGESFTVFGDGSQTRDFVFVRDLADFYVKAVSTDVKNEVVNLGTGRGTTIKEILTISGELLGIDPVIVNKPPRPGEIENFVADVSKLRRLFSETPSTSLKMGIEKTFSWLSSR